MIAGCLLDDLGIFPLRRACVFLSRCCCDCEHRDDLEEIHLVSRMPLSVIGPRVAAHPVWTYSSIQVFHASCDIAERQLHLLARGRDVHAHVAAAPLP